MKKLISLLLVCVMWISALPALTESAPAAESLPSGQLTLADLEGWNGPDLAVYTHDGRVTFVDGACTDQPVATMEDATAVVSSMMGLIGADADTEFIPWRDWADPLGHHYYVFQQMYRNTTVCGGAVKVITDADNRMIGLTSSVESKMPEVEETTITAADAERIVADTVFAQTNQRPEVYSRHTDQMILPTVLKLDFENEDESTRFVWVVYTNNVATLGRSSDLPYLAHYVAMSGEYLYNMPAFAPDDEASRAGYDAAYLFDFMEPAEYTGYVDMSDGSERLITVTLMRDRRTGMYYLGNIERRIAVAQCWDFLFDGGKVILEYSPDNREWDQTGLLSLYNYCRAWDYYHAIGWDGPDGLGTPMIILNNFCDDYRNATNNACYVGHFYGFQVFAASSINDFSQCLDILAHEFTHGVTHSITTYYAYRNDTGAIDEALSDIQGKNADQMAGEVALDDWVLGTNSNKPVRSMQTPNDYSQPAYTWDLYYQQKVNTPTNTNDHGGVHSNSSLLNHVDYFLVTDGGMTLEEVRLFWFMVDCALVPGADFAQLTELLPWVLRIAGLDRLQPTLAKAIAATRMGDETLPDTIPADRALVTLSFPETETFDHFNWILMMPSVRVSELFDLVATLVPSVLQGDFSLLPESLQKYFDQEEEKLRQTTQEKSGLWGLLDTAKEVIKSIGDSEPAPAMKTDDQQKEFVRALRDWIQHLFQEYVSFPYLMAGADGLNVRAMVRSGRTIPILCHMTVSNSSEKPDQLAVAVLFDGKWYDLGLADVTAEKEADGNFELTESARDFAGVVMEKIFSNLGNIRSLEDVVNLLTVEIPGGEPLVLPSEGLDQVKIPAPTPPAEKTWGTIEPGPKSRPVEQEPEALPDAA